MSGEPITPGWSGTLTLDNMDTIAVIIHEILIDKMFTYIMWVKNPNEQEWTQSHDYSERTYLTKDVYTAQKKIWLYDNFGSIHLGEGLTVSFDPDEQGFVIEEPWQPERPTYKYQYHVNPGNIIL